MKRLRKIPIRIQVPLIVLIYSALAATLTWRQFHALSQATVQKSESTDAAYLLEWAQKDLEYFLRQQDQSAAGRVLERLRGQHELKGAALVGPEGKVLLATEAAWVGKQAEQIDEPFLNLNPQEQGQDAERFRVEQGGLTLRGSYPVVLSNEGGKPRQGLLLAEFELQRELHQASAMAWRQFLFLLTSCLALSGVLAWYLELALHAPIKKLIRMSRQIAREDYDVEPERAWTSELTQIGEAFADMARNLKSNKVEREQMAHRLEARQDRLDTLIATVPGVVCSFGERPDGMWYFPFASPQIEGVYGVSPARLAQDASPIFERIHPEDRDHVAASIRDSARAMSPWHDLYRVNSPERGEIWIEGHSTPIRNEEGGIVWHGIILDVTERKHTEILAEGQKQILGMIAQGVPLAETLDALLRVIEAHSPEMICSILLLDRDGIHLHDAAAPRLPPAYRKAIDGIAIGPAVGSCGTACFRRERVFVQDIATDPLWQDYRGLALAHGLRACLGSPILNDKGSALGTFAIYFENPTAPLPHHLAVIDMATATVAVAIERHRAEESLQRSEAQGRAVLDNLLSFVGLLEPDGTVVWVNRASLDAAGLSLEEVVGRKFWDCRWWALIPAGPEVARSTVERAARGEHVRFDTLNWTLANERLEIDYQIVPLRGDADTVRYLIPSAVDVTERNRVERQLREQEEQYRAVVETLQDGFYIVDGQGRFLEVNDAYLRRSGYGREELLGMNLAQVEAQERPTDITAHMLQVAEKGNDRFETWHRARDGTAWPVEILASHWPGRGGRFFAFSRDLTERRATLALIRESEARHRALVETSFDWIWELDVHGQYSYVSPRVTEILGYTPQEVLGKSPFDFMPPADSGRIRKAFQGIASRRESFSGLENTNRHKDGREVTLETSGVPILGPNGDFLGYRGTDRDVTARKKAEQAIKDRERLLSIVTRSARVGLVVEGADYRIRFANEAYRSMLGLEDGEMVGRRTPDLLPQAWHQVRPQLDRALAGERVEYELTLPACDRIPQPRHLSLVYQPLQQLGGERAVVVVAVDITTRKVMEESLRESERRIRAIGDNLPGGIIFQYQRWPDGRKRFLYFSQGVERILGVSAQEATANSDAVRSLTHPEDANSLEAAELESMASQAVFRCEFRIRTPDGAWRWAQVHSAPRRQPDGSTLWDGVTLDVTEAKRAEQALRDSEERFRQFIDNSPTIAWLKDEQGTYALVNQTWRKRCDADQIDPIGKTDLDLWPGTDAGAYLDNDRKVLEADAPLEFEEGNTGPDGTRGSWLVLKFPFRDASGKRFVGGIGIDVTARKRAEEVLRQSEIRFRTFVDHATDGFFLHAEDGRILDVNQEACAALGYTREELIGEHPSYFDPTFSPGQDVSLKHTLDAMAEEVFDTTHRRKDGTTFPVEVRIRPFILGGRRLAVSLARNITSRLKADAALREREARIRAIVDSALDCIISIDLEGNIVEFNPAAERTFGYPRSEILGKDLTEHLVPAHMRPMHHASLRKFREVGTTSILGQRRETVAMRADGSEFPIEIAITLNELEGAPLLTAYLRDITERRQAEQSLRESERRLALAVEAGNVGLWDWDIPSGRVVFSDSLLAMLGYAPGDWEPDVKMWAGRIHPEDRPTVELELGRHLKDGTQVYQVEHRLRCKNGEWRWTVDQGQVIERDPAGNPVRMVGAHVDIDSRKKTEEELRQSKRRIQAMNSELETRVHERTAELEAMLANASIGLAYLDSSLRWIRINGTLAEINGLPVEAQLGHRMMDVLPEIAALVEPAVRQVYATGLPIPPTEVEVARPGSPSERGTYLVSYFPVRVGERVISVGAAVVDITDLKKTERRLGEANRLLQLEVGERRRVEQLARRLASILENSPDFVAIGEVDHQVSYMNRAFRETLGLDPQAPLPLVGHGHPDWAMALVLEEGVPTAIREGAWRKETAIVAHTGQVIPVSQLIMVHRDTQGSVEYISTLMRDVSELKRVEEELRNRSADLQAANALLDKANRMKDEFLASMSHELRTPLNGILSLSEGLLEGVYGQLGPNQAGTVSLVEQSGRHLLELINDVLDLAKVEAGKITLDLAPMSIMKLCRATVRLVKQLAQKKQQSLDLTLDPQVDILLGDERRLKQVLVNLLSNAIKFTPNGGKVRLEVRGDPLQATYSVTVTDTGIGISKEDQTRLFQPFTQIDSRLSRQYSGTGLGLALVLKMVELHNGGVALESEPGKGSRFAVTLPWRPANPLTLQEEPFPVVSSPVALPAEASQGPRILVAEDNEINARALLDSLVAAGYQVDRAADGRQALEMARETPPDVILMDIQMPVMDGLQVIGHLRNDPALRHIPIIAVTALAMLGDRERCLEAGANDYLSKPIHRAALLTAIQRLLREPTTGGNTHVQ